MRLCTYQNCTNKYSAKGLCRQHYNVLIKRPKSREWYSKNKEKKAAQSAKWFKENSERWKEYNKNLYQLKKSLYNENSKNWRKINPEKSREYRAKYRASKLQATPKWANFNKIKEIYRNCPKGYEVDHIVPLQGSGVCGLHVEYNLQYLTVTENRSKGCNLLKGNHFE